MLDPRRAAVVWARRDVEECSRASRGWKWPPTGSGMRARAESDDESLQLACSAELLWLRPSDVSCVAFHPHRAASSLPPLFAGSGGNRVFRAARGRGGQTSSGIAMEIPFR